LLYRPINKSFYKAVNKKNRDVIS